MDAEGFWRLVESARGDGGVFAEALAGRLVKGSESEILGFEARFDELYGAVYRWDVWAAAYLIGGGCSDDSFMDFRAGLFGLGREWYERVALAPDSLAGHPGVIAGDEVVFDEAVLYAAGRAHARLTGGDIETFHAAWERFRAERGIERIPEDMGEDFDFDDDDEMRRRLPRLAALLLDEETG